VTRQREPHHPTRDEPLRFRCVDCAMVWDAWIRRDKWHERRRSGKERATQPGLCILCTLAHFAGRSLEALW